MNDVLLTPIRLNELELLIQNSVEKAMNVRSLKDVGQINQSEKFLTIQEASKYLFLTVPTLYSKCSKREIPFCKRNGRLYFSSSELVDYIKQGRKKSNAEIEGEADTYLLTNKKGLKL